MIISRISVVILDTSLSTSASEVDNELQPDKSVPAARMLKIGFNVLVKRISDALL